MDKIGRVFSKTALLLAVIVLSGCSLLYGDDLLEAPRLPEEYKMLQVKLDEISAGGTAFLVAADSGSARQSVQLIDLDGDGEDEAVAFFRTSEGEIHIYIFRRGELGYEQMGRAIGFGPSLHSVSYPRTGAGGALALAVAWGHDGGGYGMTIYGLGGETGLYVMLDIQYVEFAMHDIESNGSDEMVFIRRSGKMDTADPRYYAAFYSVRDDVYKEFSAVDLCKEVRSVSSLTFGKTVGGVPALFIDSQSIGGGYVTDLVSLAGNQAVNETMDMGGETGRITFRSLSVLSADIDGDGITEIPTTDMSRDFEPDSPGDTTRGSKLYWKQFSNGIDIKEVALTYHNVADKWFIFWPENWEERVYAEYTKTSYMQRTRFYLPVSDEQLVEMGENQHTLLNIYVFSGDDRDAHRKMYSSARLLRTTASGIYCYTVAADAPLSEAVTSEQAEKMFHTIESAWRGEG